MASPDVHSGPLRRVLRSAGDETLNVLASLPGADLTTLLLEVMRQRAGDLSAPDVLRRYREDRFVAPGQVPFHRLRAAEDAILSALPETFEILTLAPVAPLGTHSVLGTVNQDKVLSTVRRNEVAADPTNALTLEAAVRRADPDRKPTEAVRLAAVQRVTRAQVFSGPASFAHFTLMGAVSAGRDTGNLAFERQHAVEHIRFAVSAVQACGTGAGVRLTAWEPRYRPVLDTVRTELSGQPGVDLVDDPDRVAGRGYYTGFCFKVFSLAGDEPFEIGDGGFLDWTQALLGNRKERLITCGLGIDRLAP